MNKVGAEETAEKHVGLGVRCWRTPDGSVSGPLEGKGAVWNTEVAWVCRWQLPVAMDVCKVQIEANRSKFDLAGHQLVFDLPVGG